MARTKQVRDAEADAAVFDSVTRACADKFVVSHEAILGIGRPTTIATARMVSYWVLRNSYKWPWHQIARAYKRSHSTIISGSRLVDWMLMHHPWMVGVVSDLNDKLGVGGVTSEVQ